jgi:hypothetical protein
MPMLAELAQIHSKPALLADAITGKLFSFIRELAITCGLP